jgi:hypothetical protein
MSSFFKKKEKTKTNEFWHIRIFFEILLFNNGLKKKFKRGTLNFLTYVKIKTNAILGRQMNYVIGEFLQQWTTFFF